MMKTLREMIAIGLMIVMIMVNSLPVSASEPVKPVRNNTDLTQISNGVKVAILDSGSNITYKEGISLIDGTVRDYNGHGTLMAEIIKEVNPNAELYIVKVMGKDGLAVNEEAVILGLEWAISRDVDVINMSLRLKDSPRLHQAIKKAHDKGIVIIAAAGNKTSKMNTLTTEYEVAYPARYSEVIAVGALDKYGKVYSGSIKGEGVDICCKGYKGRKAGTSIASAYAAGLAANVISGNPDSNIQEVKNLMLQKAERGELR